MHELGSGREFYFSQIRYIWVNVPGKESQSSFQFSLNLERNLRKLTNLGNPFIQIRFHAEIPNYKKDEIFYSLLNLFFSENTNWYVGILHILKFESGHVNTWIFYSRYIISEIKIKIWEASKAKWIEHTWKPLILPTHSYYRYGGWNCNLQRLILSPHFASWCGAVSNMNGSEQS